MEPQPIQEQPAKVEAVPPEISRAIGMGLMQQFAKEIESIQDGIMVLDLPARNLDAVAKERVQQLRNGADEFVGFLTRLSEQPVQLKESVGGFWIFEFSSEEPPAPIQPGDCTVNPELTSKIASALAHTVNNTLTPMVGYSQLLGLNNLVDIVGRTFARSIHSTTLNVADAVGELRKAHSLSIQVDEAGKVTLTPTFQAPKAEISQTPQ